MSTTSNGRQSGREKLAELKAQEARAAQQKRLLAVVSALVVVVLVGVGVMWVISNNNSNNANKQATAGATNTAFIKTVTSIPESTYNKVGAGKANVFPQATGGSADKVDGKPRVLYIGAEYCPYCAMERWSLVAALSRFGTWTGLKGQVSSPNEAQLSNIQTMTFIDAKYTSKYLAFTGWETKDRDENPLQTPSSADMALFNEYNQQGSIPFILYGGTSDTIGATWDGSMLPGLSNTQIANDMTNPSTTISQGAVGAANVITAQLCNLTGGEPSNVCTSAGVQAAAAKLTTK